MFAVAAPSKRFFGDWRPLAVILLLGLAGQAHSRLFSACLRRSRHFASVHQCRARSGLFVGPQLPRCSSWPVTF